MHTKKFVKCKEELQAAHLKHVIFHDVIKGMFLIIIVLVISSMVMVLLFTSSFKFSCS